MSDYEAEEIVKKTLAVRRKIREFYSEFPQYSPYAHVTRDNPTKAQTNKTITKKVMSKYYEPEVREITNDIHNQILKEKLKMSKK